jgi:6-hydroxy-3-succinoylpyridine 3-monooxygenase
MAKNRTIVYIDGFNFYYGAVRNTPHKWLNFDRLFEILRPYDDIRAIKYFTAEIVGPTLPNQLVFLSALATQPRIKIILGRFKQKRIKCEVALCVSTVPKFFDKPEEKRTDVNIATEMLDDAYQNECDQFILVSGDSDLAPAVHRIRHRFPKKRIVVYIPAIQSSRRSGAYELRAAATQARTFPLNLLPRAQFPAQIPDGMGGFINKPATW